MQNYYTQKKKKKEFQGRVGTKRQVLLSGTAPRGSTFCLPDIIAHDEISQAFPLRICIL